MKWGHKCANTTTHVFSLLYFSVTNLILPDEFPPHRVAVFLSLLWFTHPLSNNPVSFRVALVWLVGRWERWDGVGLCLGGKHASGLQAAPQDSHASGAGWVPVLYPLSYDKCYVRSPGCNHCPSSWHWYFAGTKFSFSKTFLFDLQSQLRASPLNPWMSPHSCLPNLRLAHPATPLPPWWVWHWAECRVISYLRVSLALSPSHLPQEARKRWGSLHLTSSFYL